MKKTTAKHFEIFSSCVEKWLKHFGIWAEWRVYFEHCPDPVAYARYLINYSGRVVTFRLSTDWPSAERPLTNMEVEKSAKHEAIHLLTSDLFSLASTRYIQEDELNTVSEALVRRLEKLL